MSIATNGTSQKTTAQMYRELLESDPKTALELAISENERARSRITEMKEVRIGEDGRFVANSLGGLIQVGHFLASSQLVPERFQGHPNDCAIGAWMAHQLGQNALMVLQSLYIVHGTPGLEGKLVIAIMNASPKIKGRVKFELGGEGMERYCIASAVDRETGETHSQKVTLQMARDEGWDADKKTMKSKWKTMPDLMLQYRAGAFLGRVSFSDVIMGLHTAEELEDVYGSVEGEVIREVSDADDFDVSQAQDPALQSPVDTPEEAAAPNPEPDPEPDPEPMVEAEPNPEEPESPAPDEPGPPSELQMFVGRFDRCTTAPGIKRLLSAAEQSGDWDEDQLRIIRGKASARIAQIENK